MNDAQANEATKPRVMAWDRWHRHDTYGLTTEYDSFNWPYVMYCGQCGSRLGSGVSAREFRFCPFCATSIASWEEKTDGYERVDGEEPPGFSGPSDHAAPHPNLLSGWERSIRESDDHVVSHCQVRFSHEGGRMRSWNRYCTAPRDWEIPEEQWSEWKLVQDETDEEMAGRREERREREAAEAEAAHRHGNGSADEEMKQAMACLSCGLAGSVPDEHYPLRPGLWDQPCPQCDEQMVWITEA
jgi:predicted RNA-binding Zn-ribbon protein involved in translation (DUF1610 family)